MWILYLFLAVVAAAGFYAGREPYIQIEMLSGRKVLHAALSIILLFALLFTAYSIGWFPQEIAAPFMMILYSIAAGFFAGYALRLFTARSNAGSILYQNRSFLVDHAPNFFAIALILYGIYRSSVLTDLPITGIRITSGLSIITFGIFGLTLKVVPEFRTKGIMFLDRMIHWKQLLSWKWISEEVLSVDYFERTSKKEISIKSLVTSVPPEDRKQAEAILKMKLDQFAEERNKDLHPDEDS